MKEKPRVVLRLDLYVSLESEDKGDLRFSKRVLEDFVAGFLKDHEFEEEVSFPQKQVTTFDSLTEKFNILGKTGFRKYQVKVLREDEVIKELK